MSSKKSEKVKNIRQKNKPRFSKSVVIGIIFILIALTIPAKTFSPVIKSEINYQINKKNPERVEGVEPTPINTDFSIVIPKISANTKVIPGVNPFDSNIYQQALTQGVAQASTSDTPDKNGNVFIFAHSAGNWYQANQYNAVFYLLNKLKPSDKIFVYFKNKKYSYSVTDIKTVDAKQADYLNRDFGNNQLTLMTCWPPGTTLKRLLVIAKLQND